MSVEVLTVGQVDCDELARLLACFGLELVSLPDTAVIAGSYWGDAEAGLRGSQVLARRDTPVHSVLHESCHSICMTPERRAALAGDAGGDYDEENAVCFLQIVLAGSLSFMDADRMCRDMDAWGYTFRLGSAAAWFSHDAGDAREWLIRHGLLDASGALAWRCRGAAKPALSC